VTDNIYTDFVERQGAELTQLCDSSSRLACRLIQPDTSMPANIFMVKIQCANLIKVDDQVRRSEEACLLAIQLPSDYVRRAYPNPGQILSLVAPRQCWHPNVLWPHICAGPIAPGTPVVELVLRGYEILTYNKFTPIEHDCLNPPACRWARSHMSEFPLERRPLRDAGQPRSAEVDASHASGDLHDFDFEAASPGVVS
jgi:hypothetical protein